MSLKKISVLTILALGIYSCNKVDVNAEMKSEVTQHQQTIEGQYIVRLNPSVISIKAASERNDLSYAEKSVAVQQEIKQHFVNNGLNPEISRSYFNATLGFVAKLDAKSLEELSSNPAVLSIEKDVIISLGKPSGKGGGGSTPVAQTTPWGITRVGGGNTTSTGKKAWVIDSGIDMDHEDLNVDQVNSQSFLSGGGASSPDDQNGHGTHVAGTIAAIDNNVGVVGVAPGSQVVSVRVLDRRGSGALSGVIAGVDYVSVTANSGDVANLSLGGGISTTLDQAITNLANHGVLVVVAAGNESDDANNHSPARVNHPNVFTISAMDINDNFAYFSNFGTPVDFCAPGVDIKSTWKGNAYNTISGTSMAAPHVAGILMLGNVNMDGFVNNDPDGNADPIAHL